MKGTAVDHDLEDWLETSYAPSVRTAYLILGNRADAEDAVQEAFLKAWRYRDALDDDRRFAPWLYRIVINTCNSTLRREIPHRDRRCNEDALATTMPSEDIYATVAQASDVADAVRALPLALRVVVVLRYYADMSERDIADVINRQPGTVKSRLNTARAILATHPALATSETSNLSSEENEG